MNGPIEPITRLAPRVSLRRVERHPRPADERDQPRDQIDLHRPDGARSRRLMLQILADALEDPQVSAEARQAETPETARDLAAWLLQAINGILVNDFLDANPSPAPEVFDYFVTEVRADLERGAVDAEEVLIALGAFDDDAQSTLALAMSLLNEALVRFAADARRELRESRSLVVAAALRDL